MDDISKEIELLIQEKFLKVLQAKKEGKLYDFRKELRLELEAKAEVLKKEAPNKLKAVESLLNELEDKGETILN